MGYILPISFGKFEKNLRNALGGNLTFLATQMLRNLP
jgi:hypothetical protein